MVSKLLRVSLAVLLVLSIATISSATSGSAEASPSVLARDVDLGGRIRASHGGQLSNMRQEFSVALSKMNATKLSLPWQKELEEMLEVLNEFVGALSSAIQLESSGMTMEERQVVASAHFDSALLHLSSVLPLFTPKVAKTSIFYTPDGYQNREVEIWKQDWLVKLAMAVEEDSASALDFDNTLHYVLYDIFPLNIPSALYHLNKASLLGHTSARSLFAILSKMGSRSLPPSTPLPESTYDKPSISTTIHSTLSDLTKSSSAGETSGSSETSHNSDSSSSSTGSSSHLNENTPARVTKQLSMADWKVLEHIFQDLSAGGKSPSALMLEGYQHLYGVDTQAAHCVMAKRALKDATAPLLELLKQRTPSPRLDFDQLAVPPQKLAEKHSGQSMGSYKENSQYEHLDLIDYYAYQAREPHQHLSKNAIGSIYLFGTYGYERNYEMARQYFAEADRVHPSSQLAYMYHQGLIPSSSSKGSLSDRTSSNHYEESSQGGKNQKHSNHHHNHQSHHESSSSSLGSSFESGKYEADVGKAVSMYVRAAAHNNSFALTQLGLLHLRGNEEAKIVPDVRKAVAYLTKAAEREEVEANFQLGVLYRTGMAPHVAADPLKAHKHIIFAAAHGHLGALLELAALTGRCEDAVHLHMRVLTSALLQPLAFRAHEFYERGLYEHAAVLYNIMAALGHETGQLNAAWLHERGLVALPLAPLDFANLLPLSVPSLAQTPHGAHTLAHAHFQKSFDSLTARLHALNTGAARPSSFLSSDEDIEWDVADTSDTSAPQGHEPSQDALRHAFELYRLAAQQGSAEAQLKQGDFYYYGIGVPVDYNRSAQFYLLAANAKHAQAAFNLGYLYQRGIGTPTDLHLAKRYYDLAITSSPDAHLPASIALFSLQIQTLLLGALDPSDFHWDNTLLIILGIATAITITLRFRLR